MCGTGIVIDFNGVGLQHAGTWLYDRLLGHVAAPSFENEYNRGLGIFWNSHPEGADTATLSLRFQDWIIFDHRLRGGRRVIEAFREEHAGGLNMFQAELLEKWVDSYFGMFRVVETNGALVRLREIISGECHDIEPWREGLPTGIVVSGRPLWFGASYRLKGAIEPSSAAFTGTSPEEELGRKYRRLEALSPGITPAQFYRLCGHFMDTFL